YTWLGIPLAEQPANHYRLLGLALFEPDAQVIAHSADRYMGYVRTMSTGPQAATAKRVLAELTAAKRCLLEPDKRAEYDAALKTSLPPASAPHSSSTESPLPPNPLAPVVAVTPVSPARAVRSEAPDWLKKPAAETPAPVKPAIDKPPL